METFDREKRDRIYAHAYAQVWQERLDAFRKAGRATPQMTYDELLNLAFTIISSARQKELGATSVSLPCGAAFHSESTILFAMPSEVGKQRIVL